jgi:SecD/SecF fusion protein
MVRPFKKDINFLARRKLFFVVSALLVVAAIVATPVRSINFGIDFVGGTSVNFSNTGEISTEEMRQAFEQQAVEAPIVQTTTDAAGNVGFIVRIPTTDAAEASSIADAVVQSLGLADD